jgi:hypothetical protein
LFFFKQPPAAARSSYVGETNVVAKAIDSSINLTPASPEPNPLIERLISIHSWRLPPKQFGLFKTQLTVNVKTEVIPLGVKLSIHS